jgi:hypothetical protein
MTSSAEVQARPDSAARWHAIEASDRESFGRALIEARNLVQWLARIANSYVAGNTAEDRVVLEFRAADAAYVTQPFDQDIGLEMRLPSLEMQFLEDGRPAPHVFDPEGHSPAEVEAWLLVELLHRGLDRARFSKALPYSIPDLMSGDADDHAPSACQQGLAQLAGWLRNAAGVLAAADETGKAHVVCLPQGLELTCVSPREPKRGSELALVPGFGFSPGDERNPEPFFYRDATVGRGRTVLTASELARESNPAATAIKFISSAAI